MKDAAKEGSRAGTGKLRPAPPDHPETGSRSQKDSANRRSIREPKNTPPDEPAGLLYRLLPKKTFEKPGLERPERTNGNVQLYIVPQGPADQ